MTKNIDIDDDEDAPYSSYWMDDNEGGDDTRILKLASIRRAIANFVYILTSDTSIQVKFSSGTMSYTDGKTVVISADDSPTSFDTTVGLALHEAAHCLLSNFEFLRIISRNVDDFYAALSPELRAVFGSTTKSKEEFETEMQTLRAHMMHIMNIIEDRRIDSYVYRTAPGYRPYYDSLYTDYHFTADIAKNLKHNPEWREPTIGNYMTWMLMMMSPNFIPTALPALDVITKLIDLDNIHRLDASTGPASNTVFGWTNSSIDPLTYKLHFDQEQFSEAWRLTNRIMVIILQQAKMYAQQTDTPFEFAINGMDVQDSEIPNLDVPKGKFNNAKGRKGLDNIRDLMEGKNRRRKLTKVEQEQIFSIDSADARLTEHTDAMVGTVPCLVTRKLTPEVLYSSWFPFGPKYESKYTTAPSTSTPYDSSVKGIAAGVVMGQLLTHLLQIRNDPTITHFTRREHGKIDRRLLAQLGMDITSIFKRTTIDQYQPAMLHLSLDASSSMSGRKWEKIITVATALAYTAEKIQNLDVVIILRATTKKDMPVVSVVYDSRIDKFHKIRNMFPYLRPRNRTPEGLAFLASMDLIQECVHTHRVYFINFSDGEPLCHYIYKGNRVQYERELAKKHSKRMVQDMKSAGVSILAYFIVDKKWEGSYAWSVFKHIYGVDSEFVDVQHALSVLRTLNKLLTVKE